MNQFQIVTVADPQGSRMDRRRQNLAHYQSVAAEGCHRLQPALQMQRGIPQESPLHLAGFNRVESSQYLRLVDFSSAGAGGQSGQQDLVGPGVADREVTVFSYVDLSPMGRRADKSEVVVSAHGEGHMLGREIDIPLAIHRADNNQRCDRKESVPDRMSKIERLHGYQLRRKSRFGT